MSWSQDLKKIRRLLRDPNGNIWTDTFLLNMYNDVQKDFQHETSILEDFAIQRVPGLYHFSYMYEWEYEELPTSFSSFYQCLKLHDDYTVCHRWETQVIAGIDIDISDYGAHWTQPWEAFMGELPGDPVRMRFPSNMRNLKYMAYDEEPIGSMSKKQVQSIDSSYITVSGTPRAFYPWSETDKDYVLYPRPSSSFDDEVDGNEGPAWYIEDDTEDATTGTIAVRIGSTGTNNVGVPFDITDVTNNVFMVYDVNPTDIITFSDEGDYPVFLKKYIRFGVVARAYGANTDGRIRSLAKYWAARYNMGIKTTMRYRRNRKNDRDYRLTTHGAPRPRTRKHPRLPDTYPAVNP